MRPSTAILTVLGSAMLTACGGSGASDEDNMTTMDANMVGTDINMGAGTNMGSADTNVSTDLNAGAIESNAGATDTISSNITGVGNTTTANGM